MIKKYSFDYDMGEASVTFVVDLEQFTPEMANSTLEFFSWDYDKDADPIDEVMKKYAMKAIQIASDNSFNEFGVISEFENEEGFCVIDGRLGIRLTEVTGYELSDDKLQVETETV